MILEHGSRLLEIPPILALESQLRKHKTTRLMKNPSEQALHKTLRFDIDDIDGSDTEEEVELVDLLQQEIEKALEEAVFNIAEKYCVKRYQRLASLAARKLKYQIHMVDTLFRIGWTQCLQLKWEEAKSNFTLVYQKSEKERQDSLGELHFLHTFFFMLAQIELGELKAAMLSCSRTLKARRKMYGKTDVRYFEILALKIRIWVLEGDVEEATAYRGTLPEDKSFSIIAGEWSLSSADVSSLTKEDVLKISSQILQGWATPKLSPLSQSFPDIKQRPTSTPLNTAVHSDVGQKQSFAASSLQDELAASNKFPSCPRTCNKSIRLWTLPITYLL